MKNNLIKIFSLLLIVAVLTQAFQNCGGTPNFSVIDGSSEQASSEMPVSHPASVELSTALPTQHGYTVNRDYVASLLRDIFASNNYPISDLETQIYNWVINKPGAFGEGCDLYSSYTGRDCGSSVSNTGVDYSLEPNSVRESFKIQACDRILNSDNSVKAALEKISLTVSADINAANVASAYELFYRGKDLPADMVQALVDLPASMPKETTTVRWRAVLTLICESAGWESF